MSTGQSPRAEHFSNRVMKKIIEKYQDAVLIFATLVLLGIIAAFYFWGIRLLVVNLGSATNPEKVAPIQETQFRIEAAKEILKRRGLAL